MAVKLPVLLGMIGAAVAGAVAVGVFLSSGHHQDTSTATYETQMLADPSLGALAHAWRDADPAAFSAFAKKLSDEVRAGHSPDDMTDTMRDALMAAAAPHIPELDDAHMVETIRIARDEFGELADTHPTSCRAMFIGQPFGDIRPYLSSGVRGRELALFAAAFSANPNTQHAVMSGLDYDAAVSGLFAATRARVGDDFSLMAPDANISAHETRYCQVVSAFFESMLALPQADAAALIRGMRAASGPH